MKLIKIHATYAGKSLAITVEVVPPSVKSISLSPDTVVCGNSSIATVTLNRASQNGPVVLDIICGAPGFATVPAHLTIPQNHISGTFTITTPDILLPFNSAHATIFAIYSGSFAFAILTIKPKIIAGIIKSLTLFPSTIKGGGTTHGTVILEQAVATDTLVGLGAKDGGGLPQPGGGSTEATVPPSITIFAGNTTGMFPITTKPLNPGVLKKTVTIMAGAVAMKYAMLTVKN